MRTAFVYFTLNAESSCDWAGALFAVSGQALQPDLKLIVDSESSDKTVELARNHCWEIYTVKRSEFNHGLTRDQIVRYLAERGYDIAVFASQDVALAVPDSLKTLIEFLKSHHLVGAYGRQQTIQHNSTLNDWQRKRCYPDTSMIKEKSDIPALGLNAAFCSNAFCAWNLKKLIEYGGFPESNFGEDMLAAAKIILAGGQIGYCAEAVCYHDHSSSLRFLFTRGFQIGYMHGKNPWLLKEFGTPEHCLPQTPVPTSIVLQLAVKYAGYLGGKLLGRSNYPWLAFILLWLVLLPMIFFADMPFRDVTSRYAPMAEAFVDGNWDYAFHPRIPPLFPTIAGIFTWLFHISGFVGCKLASTFMLTFGVFPIWAAVKNLYNEKTAKVTLLLYCCCSYLLRLGYGGIRETISVFGVLLAYYAMSLLVKNKKSFAAIPTFAAAMAILLLNRGDACLLVLTCGIIFLIWDIVKHKIPLRTFAVAVISLLLLSPWLSYNYIKIGYPVTDVRHAAAIRILDRKLPLSFLRNPTPHMKLDIGMPGVEELSHE